eukprot:2185916-Pleurochrysis_carterae.AAC.1
MNFWGLSARRPMSRPGSACARNVDVDAGDNARHRPSHSTSVLPVQHVRPQVRHKDLHMRLGRHQSELNRVRAFESINYLPSLCIDMLCVRGLPQDGQPSKPWRAESGFKENDTEILLMAIQHTKSSLMNGWRPCFCKSTATPAGVQLICHARPCFRCLSIVQVRCMLKCDCNSAPTADGQYRQRHQRRRGIRAG